MTQRIFGITGWKNSGKTTLTERLITELSRRGWKVSSIKHAHHAFDIDHPGTDSYRHRAAGASEVAIVSSNRWALVHELRDETEPELADILRVLAPSDIVLIEGYKRGGHPKIEVRRRETVDRGPLAPDDPTILAIASDHETKPDGLPLFDLNAVPDIATFIELSVGLLPPTKVA
jgi:molybdopterin-guanine dinucleotide biosynthesis adapter protein